MRLKGKRWSVRLRIWNDRQWLTWHGENARSDVALEKVHHRLRIRGAPLTRLHLVRRQVIVS